MAFRCLPPSKKKLRNNGLVAGQKLRKTNGQEALNKAYPLKTNIFPENQWLEDYFPFKLVPFQELC